MTFTLRQIPLIRITLRDTGRLFRSGFSDVTTVFDFPC